MMHGTSAFLQRPFGRLYFESVGEARADAPPLVFAHGLGGNHLSWWQQVAHFSKTHRCISFAHRSFAPSDPLHELPRISDFADDLAALLDHCAVQDCVLVAQSMGGWTAVEYALKYPQRVRAIVFACTTGSIDFTKAAHAALARLPEWEAHSQKTLTDWKLRGINPACGARMEQEQPALHELYNQVDRMKIGFDKPAMLDALWAARVRHPDELKALNKPVLFMSGLEDIVIPPCGVEAVAAVTGGDFLAVPEAGHSVYFERADIFNQALAQFLNKI
ncbi:MAG: alpha/beta fold hydrolase [Beijerinckiaceae bacterium]